MSGAKNLHFLVVDDDAESRATVVEYLTSLGYSRVSQAANGADAGKVLDREPSINFIISDWDMPMINGITLLQQVKSHPKRANIPFLIITSPISMEVEKIVLAAENMVDAYLIKPFRSDAFKEKLDKLLAQGAQKAQSASAGAKQAAAEPTQVVVVDDDDDAREMIIDYLKAMGHGHIIGLKNGREALDHLQAHHREVSLVVSDWEMPKLSGIELLKHCKGDPNLQKIPFLMVTSQSSIERMKVVQAAKASVDEYLLKPFSSEEIKKRVETLMSRTESRGEVQVQVTTALEELDKGNSPAALFHLEQALKLDPAHDLALRSMGDILIREKGVEAALPYYKRAVEANPMNARNFVRLSAAYEQTGFLDKAVALLQGAMREIGFSAELHFQLGKVYMKKGMKEQAMDELRKTLEIQLDHQEARLLLGTLSQEKD